MTWLLVILLLIVLFLLWLLLAPMQVEIDSRKPAAQLRWISIGRGTLWYKEEWRFSFRVFFFHKTIRIAGMKAKPKKLNGRSAKKPRKRRKGMFKKMIRVLRTFRVEAWRLALDTGDYSLNAQLYPLNFSGPLRNHLLVNFTDENYLYIRIRNRPWRMLYAYLR